MANVNSNMVLEMLRKLPPGERLKVIARALPELERDLSRKSGRRKSLFGILADLGEAPSTEEIDNARQDAWKDFPREDF